MDPIPHDFQGTLNNKNMTYDFTPWNVNCKNTKVTPLLCYDLNLYIYI